MACAAEPDPLDTRLPYLVKTGQTTDALFLLTGENARRIIDERGRTLLHIAAEYGNNEFVGRFLLMFPGDPIINAQDYEGRTPLAALLANEEKPFMAFDIVRSLIKAEADIHIRDNYGKSALQLAVSMNLSSSNIIVEFINAVKQECGDDSEKTALKLLAVGCPLRHVIYLGKPELTRVMLKNGCPIDAADPETGLTALHLTFKFLSLENLQVLLDHGADMNAKDTSGKIPCFAYHIWGISNQNIHTIEIIQSFIGGVTRDEDRNLLRHGNKQTLLVMLRSNLDLCAKDSEGRTPLHFMALNPVLVKDEEIIEELRCKKFDPNARDNHGKNVLHNAKITGATKFAQFLMELGAKADD